MRAPRYAPRGGGSRREQPFSFFPLLILPCPAKRGPARYAPPRRANARCVGAWGEFHSPHSKINTSSIPQGGVRGGERRQRRMKRTGSDGQQRKAARAPFQGAKEATRCNRGRGTLSGPPPAPFGSFRHEKNATARANIRQKQASPKRQNAVQPQIHKRQRLA